MSGSIQDEVAAASADAVALILNDTATYLAYTNPPDGAGGHVDTWTVEGTIPVFVTQNIRPRQPHDLGEEIGVRNDFTEISYPPTVVLNTRDRLAVAGEVFEIDTLQDEGTWSLLNRCNCIIIEA